MNKDTKQNIMKLTNVAKMILQSPDIKEAISKQEDVRIETVRRWIRGEDKNLTRASVVKIIKDATGLSDEQILEEVAEPVLK